MSVKWEKIEIWIVFINFVIVSIGRYFNSWIDYFVNSVHPLDKIFERRNFIPVANFSTANAIEILDVSKKLTFKWGCYWILWWIWIAAQHILRHHFKCLYCQTHRYHKFFEYFSCFSIFSSFVFELISERFVYIYLCGEKMHSSFSIWWEIVHCGMFSSSMMVAEPEPELTLLFILSNTNIFQVLP